MSKKIYLTSAVFFFLFFSVTINSLTFALPSTESHSSASAKSYPVRHSVHVRIRTQIRDIKMSLKSKKLSPSEAKNLKLSLLKVRKQELVFLKQNGSQDLTSDQKSQLDQMMDKNSSSIGETPVASANN